MSRPTKAMESPTTAIRDRYNQLTQNDNALQLASASDHELLATGKPMSLKEFSKGKRVRDLPCLVKVVDGHRSLCGYYSLGKEQMFVVLEKKNMLVVTCKDDMGGSAYAIPINTTSFHLVPYWVDTKGIRPNSFGKITANELFQSKALPPVIAVSGEFECSEHSKKTVPVGTLLFLKEEKKQVNGLQGVLRAKSQSGEMVQITPDCNGRFSILAKDVRLSLQQALDHLKPPFTMRTISDCDTLYVNVITVERVHKEDVLIGMMKATEGTSFDDVASFSRMAEVPISLNLTVVAMVPKQQKVLDDIYDFVLAEYHGVMHRPAMSLSNPADTVIMDPNPSYIDNSMDPVKARFSAHPASSVKAAPSTPLARTLLSTPLQLPGTAPNSMYRPAMSLSNPADTVIMDPNPSYTEISTGHMKTMKFSAHPASSVKTTPSTPSARTLPSIPLQLSVTAPNDREEHIYDAVPLDYYDAKPTASTQASPDSKVAVTPFKSDQPPSDDVAIDYYVTMPAETQRMAYLKKMQRGDVLQLLDAMNLSVYKDAFEQEQIDGERMACLSGDMLSELGVSKSLHRMRLMKIVSGQTSAISFISIPQFDEQQS